LDSLELLSPNWKTRCWLMDVGAMRRLTANVKPPTGLLLPSRSVKVKGLAGTKNCFGVKDTKVPVPLLVSTAFVPPDVSVEAVKFTATVPIDGQDETDVPLASASNDDAMYPYLG